jgi:tetratricopeptide (TPR) repeat protein
MNVTTVLGNLRDIIINYWKSLSPEERDLIGFVAVVVGILVTAGIGWRSIKLSRQQLKFNQRQHKEERPFPYEIMSATELAENPGFLLAPSGKLEEYVERKAVKDQLGPDLLPDSRRVLISGPSGIGKTREAIEIIQRLNSYKRRNVYSSTRSIEIPTGLPPGSPYRNLVLFIDDVEIPRHKKEEDELWARRLQETIDAFAKFAGEEIDVILTAKTKEYEILSRKLSDFGVLDEFEFIELKEMSSLEKKSYIRNLAVVLKFDPLDEPIVTSLANASTESLAQLYDKFSRYGKNRIDEEDVEDFRAGLKIDWKREIYPTLTPDEQSIFKALSKLEQFSIPIFSPVVIELCTFLKDKGGFKIFARRRFSRAVQNLVVKKWLKVMADKIYCHESRLFLKDSDAPNLTDDLQFIMHFIDSLSKRRKYKRNLYYVLMPLARALYSHSMYEESIKLYDRILTLRTEFLPIYPENARSEVLFHKGYIYYSWDQKYWDKAENCYKESIKLNGQNFFAKHALATLYRRLHKVPESLKLLNEIIREKEKDILCYKTKLEILIETEIDLGEAVNTYRDIKRLLKSNSFPSKMALSAEFACTRFLAKMGELCREVGEQGKAERRFKKTRQQYEELIRSIPSEEKELEAIVRNAYGCFLYDILEETDNAIDQLEKALQAWPEHTYTLHKLATIYLNEAEIRTTEKARYRQKAKDNLEEVLKIDQAHYPARLSLARLEGESIDWGNLEESEFWGKVLDVYDKYKAALAPEIDSHLDLHNAIAYHSVGCFLWHVEAMAYNRGLIENKSSSIPPANVEFSESIAIAERFGETLPRQVQDHLILANFTFGSYFMTVAAGSPDLSKKGQSLLAKAENLRRQAGSDFRFTSQNSYAESFVAKLHLSMGEYQEAQRLLKSAVLRYDKNWRAQWWLGRIHERNQEFGKAIECFEKSAEGQASPELYGWLRSIVKEWMKDGKISEDLDQIIRYSRRAYELDPDGNLNPKNLSDYGYDLHQKGKNEEDWDALEKAKELLLLAYKKYKDKDLFTEANFPLWYVGRCREILEEQIDRRTLKYYIESAALQDSLQGYDSLIRKIKEYEEYEEYEKYEEAVRCLIDVIDHYPDKEDLYVIIHDECCSPIWNQDQTISPDLMSEIEECAIRHIDQPIARIMISLVLQGNRENERALPYLEGYRNSGNTFMLRRLMECYVSLGEIQKAKEVYQELVYLIRASYTL